MAELNKSGDGKAGEAVRFEGHEDGSPQGGRSWLMELSVLEGKWYKKATMNATYLLNGVTAKLNKSRRKGGKVEY